MARAGRRDPGETGRVHSQAQDAVRGARAKSRDAEADKTAKTRAKKRSGLQILAGLVDAGVLDDAAIQRVRNADRAGLSAADWRMWIQFQVELLVKALADKTLKGDAAIQRAATISREIRDYLDATGGQAAPVAVAVDARLSGEVVQQLKAAGIDLADQGDALIIA